MAALATTIPALEKVPAYNDIPSPGLDIDDKKPYSEFIENAPVVTSNNINSIPAAPAYDPEYLQWGLAQTAKAFWRSVAFTLMATVGAMFDCYALSMPQSLLANEGFILQMATETAAGVPIIAAKAITLWGVVFTLGQLTAMVAAPFISDRFGRKVAMWMLAVFLILDAVIMIESKNWKVFCAARFCSGIGSGLVQASINVYVSEIAPVRIRGALLVQYAISFAVGGVLAIVVLNEVATYAPLNYKIAFYSEFVVLGLFLPALFLAPESPLYYIRRGKERQARRSMKWLYGNVPSYDMDEEYKLLDAQVQAELEEKANDAGWRQYLECFKGTNLRRTLISFLPLVLQQSSGLVVFLGYSTYFFALAGYNKPFQASLIIQCILLFFVILSFFVIDKFGRRPLLLGGIFLVVCSNFAIGGLGYMEKPNGGAMIFISCFWAASYSMSLGPLAWAYLFETSTPSLRAKTAGIGTFGTSAFNLIWSYTIPIMLGPTEDNWGLKTAFLYGSLSALGLVAVYFTIPETKGRTFTELDEMFEAKIPVRKFKGYRSTAQAEAEARAGRSHTA